MAAALGSSSAGSTLQASSCVLEDQGDGTFLLYNPRRPLRFIEIEVAWKAFEKIKFTKVYLGGLCSRSLFSEENIKQVMGIPDTWERVANLRSALNEASISNRQDKKISNIVTNLAQNTIRAPMHKDQEGIGLLDALLEMGLDPNNKEHNDFLSKATHPLQIVVLQYALGFTNRQKEPSILARYKQVVELLTRYGSECFLSSKVVDPQKVAKELEIPITKKEYPS
jgi:hypothetical protein